MQNIHTIREIIDNSAEKFSQCTAFTLKAKACGNVQYFDISYKMFYEEIKALGTALIELDYKRVAIIGINSYEWALAYYGTVCAGITSVPLDKGLPMEEIESCIRRSGAELVMYDQEHRNIIANISRKEEFKNVKFVLMGKLLNNTKEKELVNASELSELLLKDLIEKGKTSLKMGSTSFDEVKISGDDLAAILFTSGTTSNSKAVMLTNNNIASNIYALLDLLDIYTTDVNIAFLPLHHTFGNTGLLLMLANGASTVFCEGLKYVQQNLKEYKVSIFVAVPLLLEGIYDKIIKQVKKQGKYKKFQTGIKISSALMNLGIDIRRKIFDEIHQQFGGRMRLVVSGASALNKDVAKAYNMMGIDLIQGYGLTETSPVVSGEKPGKSRYGSVGPALCNLEVKVSNPDENGVGEIIVKGPSVMKGYYNDPEETAKVIKDGWFYTGDLGIIDKDGYIFIRGRQKNVIVLKNGKNIYPEELEEKLSNISYITESIVYGEEKGEDLVVSAKIVYDMEMLKQEYPELKNYLNDDAEIEIKKAIQKDVERINDNMPLYKRIKRITVTDIPMEKTTTAKIKRYKEINNK